MFASSVGLVGYTFVGYPVIMAALAWLRPRPARAVKGHSPPLTLVVCAHNEQEVIEAKLRNTQALEYPRERLEVIVVADGSDDETVQRAERFADVKVMHRPERRGKLAAMNRAAGEARGEILVFSDANNLYSPNALAELAAPFADPTVGVVTGRKAIDDGSGRPLDRAEGIYWRYESRLKIWESAIGSVAAAAGEMLAFRREAYRSPASNTLNEDFAQVMIAAIAGWRVIYAPLAISLEAASATIGEEATRRSRLVAGRWQAAAQLLPRLLVKRPFLAWQVASHKLARPLIPWGLMGAASSSLLLGRRRRWARCAAIAQAGFYGLAGVGAAKERRGRRDRLTYLPYYFCRMNAAALRGLRDLLAGRHDVVWQRVRRG